MKILGNLNDVKNIILYSAKLVFNTASSGNYISFQDKGLFSFLH